jgi:enoyl-CoA hydratase/carnithine racemase
MATPRAPSAETAADVAVTVDGDRVATVELRRPPNNFFDVSLIRSLAAAYEALDAEPGCRVIVLCSAGKHFCAGADFARRSPSRESPADGPAPAPPADRGNDGSNGRGNDGSDGSNGRGSDGSNGRSDEESLYHEAVRLFETRKPVVAAVQGGAIGGGLGLACSADFRVASPESRFTANFARLGFHQGFGLSVTLPAIVGGQHTMDILYRGRRIGGEEAARIGLCDRLAPAANLREAAHELAADIAASAPLAVESIRRTLRGDLGGRVRAVLEREMSEQKRLLRTEDAREGIRAAAERRPPEFAGR